MRLTSSNATHRSMSLLYKLAKPALFSLDAECAHNVTLKMLKTGLSPYNCGTRGDDEALNVNLWDRSFKNPVGLAAGFDKNAEVIAPMLGMGFGFVEVGTVTPKPQIGNDKPRVFRSPEHDAVINAMGFPNAGINSFKSNLEKFLSRKPRSTGQIGLNIGMNKDQTEPEQDYKLLVQNLGPLADYLTVNISSPNTPGLRDLQKREPFLALMEQIIQTRDKSCGGNLPPVLVKFAPDLTEDQQEEMAGAAMESGVDGLILGNTTLDRPDFLDQNFAAHKGGLSGAPLKDKSTAVIHNFYKLTNGKIPIIGLGGISNGYDAYQKIKAGASLIQLYTALVFKGPGVVKEIKQSLLDHLRMDDFANIGEAVGAAHKR